MQPRWHMQFWIPSLPQIHITAVQSWNENFAWHIYFYVDGFNLRDIASNMKYMHAHIIWKKATAR